MEVYLGSYQKGREDYEAKGIKKINAFLENTGPRLSHLLYFQIVAFSTPKPTSVLIPGNIRKKGTKCFLEQTTQRKRSLFSFCLRHLCIVFACERVSAHKEVIGHHSETVYLTESWILNSGLQVCQHSTFTTE